MTDISTRYRAALPPVIAFHSQVEIVKGSGTRVTDVDGREYLDFACGIATLNLGHNHPHVVSAAKAQLDRLWHAGGAFLYDSLVTAAERLVSVTPDGIEQVFFMNSGAEAVEAAIKLARKTTGRQGVVAFRGGFHGRTMGSVSYTTSKAKYRQGYHPLLPSVFITPFPHPYQWGMSQEDADALAIDELHRMFKHEVHPEEVAAFLIEPVQGEGGYYPASPAFMAELRSVATENGILLVTDEVQTGFGRTGDWFASDVLGVRTDIIVLGKAIANGRPLSAVGASREIFSRWAPGSHGTTFGGNPVSCAAAAATIEALGDVIPGVAKLSDHAFSRFRELAEDHDTIGNVRGLGLMIGVELVTGDGESNPAAFDAVEARCLEEGMFILPCGPDGNVIRFIPPLNVSDEDLDAGIDIINRALTRYEAGS
ncbi:MAG: aminotransferase class III-fold pyridoxal phosphate-dependent enzyme [Actinobacteria bacterium]|nr:MAG: aminotransferase class III-fold pyridoxal phosphate-dependent enzyme [Actinomycetota bacterium]